MEDCSTEAIKKLLGGTPFQEIVREEVEKIVNTLIKNEFDEFLGYERYSRDGKDVDDYRNGDYTRKIMSTYGELNIVIPRDRNGDFKQNTIPPYRRTTGDLENMVIMLYRNHVTTREISELLEKMYGEYYSPASISNLSKALEEDVKAFHNRPLSPRYAAIYADSTYLPIRRGCVDREALHVLVGFTPEGKMEVIDFALYPTESADNYMEMLRNIQNRGVEDALIFITDGLLGLRSAILNEFPYAKHQACWVHIQRAVARRVRVSDRGEISSDLKKVYQANNKATAQEELRIFCDKYKNKYPKVTDMLGDDVKESLLSFFDFPEGMRKSLYSTNIIENMNKHLKRNIKGQIQFPNEASLEKAVCCHYTDYNARHADRIYNGIGQCTSDLDKMFDAIYSEREKRKNGPAASSTGGEPNEEVTVT